MAIFVNETGGTWSPWPWFSPDPGYEFPYAVAASSDPIKLWKTQPSLRKVVSYIARETAQLPWHAYQRASDHDRVRAYGSPAEQLFRRPSRWETGFRFWRNLITDLCLYDRCLAVWVDGELHRIPPRAWTVKRDTALGALRLLFRPGSDREVDMTDVPVLFTWGWSHSGVGGVSPMATLAEILDESRRSVEWRKRHWEDAPKFQGILRHPNSFRSQQSRDAFRKSWQEWRDSRKGTPILEDGMSYEVPQALNPKDSHDLEGRKLTDEEVASAYHVPPELVGARAGNYSNMQAFRSMLFGPVLGPLITDLEQAANMLLEDVLTEPDVYVELSREAALNGSLVEQAGVLQTMTGGPIMLRSEARARLNLPFVDGTDELIVPLNVLTGGQASPTDSGSQNLRFGFARQLAKARQPDREAQERRDSLQDELVRILRRQEDIIAGAGIDVDEFVDEWTPETAKRILPHLQSSARLAAGRVIEAIGVTDWDDAVMDAYLAEVATTTAGRISRGTAEALDADDEDRSVVFDTLRNASVVWAGTVVANSMGFGAMDAARHSGAATKTWRTTSANPRESHAAMNGETVGIDDVFSNGARWPGDDSLDVEEVAGCQCEIEFSWGS